MTGRRRLIVGLVLALTTLYGVGMAMGQDGLRIEDCSISGDGVLGTLIEIGDNRLDQWRVEIERNGETLVFVGHNADHQLAREGEVYRVYFEGELVASGVGVATGCDEDTTTTTQSEATTTTVVDTTTTTAPSPPPDETTTTVPGFPGTPDCPHDQVQIGTDADGNALCEPGVASG